jgi:glycine dehydrogenase subunit 1
MLAAIGVDSVEQLFDDIPGPLRRPELDVPRPLAEVEVIEHLRELAEANRDLDHLTSFLGAGWHDHHVPAFVDQLLLRSEFYTAYTPYQAEISQGTLQAIYEFQSMICGLTGLQVANASLYDGGSAVAEAINMALIATGRKTVLMADTVDPVYRAIAETYTRPRDIGLRTVRTWSLRDDGILAESLGVLRDDIDEDTACIVLQRPNFFGWIEDTRETIDRAKAAGALVVMVADPVALGILKPPGELGADIAVGELRQLAGPPSFGGPGAGYFATTEAHMRRVPGRIVGQTKDVDGKQGFVLTLQAREQHIRRERASSNVCTNQALVALAATIHLAGLGRTGLRQLAELSAGNAHVCAGRNWPDGFEVAVERPYVREFPLKCPKPAAEINASLMERNVLGGFELGRFWDELENYMLVAFTEKTAARAQASLIEALEGV